MGTLISVELGHVVAHWFGRKGGPTFLREMRFYCVGTFNKTPLPLAPPVGRYVTFRFWLRLCTMALAASIFLKATKASPARSKAREMVAAASASPSARITAA